MQAQNKFKELDELPVRIPQHSPEMDLWKLLPRASSETCRCTSRESYGCNARESYGSQADAEVSLPGLKA
eukprot:9518980-Lingulodinium_polyedra.AAC.1